MRRPVVIANGLGAMRVHAMMYGRALARYGLDVHTTRQRLLGYGDLRIATVLLDEDVKKVLERTGADKVDLVGMSLGGLIGLYYLKCGGGARYVDRFISVGGPLNGSTIAHLAAVIPSRFVHAVAQTRPDSEVMRAVQAVPAPAGVKMFSVGTHGDFLTPAKSYQAEGLETVVSPYGGYGIGHWLLFLHPGNHRIIADLLKRS